MAEPGEGGAAKKKGLRDVLQLENSAVPRFVVEPLDGLQIDEVGAVGPEKRRLGQHFFEVMEETADHQGGGLS